MFNLNGITPAEIQILRTLSLGQPADCPATKASLQERHLLEGEKPAEGSEHLLVLPDAEIQKVSAAKGLTLVDLRGLCMSGKLAPECFDPSSLDQLLKFGWAKASQRRHGFSDRPSTYYTPTAAGRAADRASFGWSHEETSK